MEKQLESELNELMTKNPKKFNDLMEKAANTYKAKFNKDIFFQTKENVQMLDGTSPYHYFKSLDLIEQWMQQCIDEIRIFIKPICYPLFVYLYLELIQKDNWNDAKIFFNNYKDKYPAFKNEIDSLGTLKPPFNKNLPIVYNYLKNKVHIFIPRTTFNFFIHFLNTNRLILILDILNTYFERSNILSKVSQNNTEEEKNKIIILNNDSEQIETINSRTPIYYNKINKDMADNINKGKGRGKGEKSILSKIIIPFPEQLNDFVNADVPNLKLNKTNPPTIGCFTVLNTNNKLNCADMTNDGGIIACGFKNGEIMIWVLDKNINIEITKKNIRELEEYRNIDFATFIKNQNQKQNKEQNQNNQNIKNSQNLKNEEENKEKPNPEFVYECITSRHRKFSLYGHTESIFSISISSNNDNIISGSYDTTIRLWNLHTKTCIAIFKGHFSPILSVKFSPLSHYFASGGCDKTARLWSINSNGPLRIFIGHLSDVEIVKFHPNSLYLITSSNDKTIRLWSIKSGDCVRIFVNYSKVNSYVDCLCFSSSGKLLCVGVYKGIIIYDLVKMGDPVSIVTNLTNKSITSISFDNDDNVIVCCTEDYKVNFYDIDSILNSEDNLEIDNEKEKKVEMIYSYMTKKTTILETKFTNSNIMLMLGRFDDNDPKIFT